MANRPLRPDLQGSGETLEDLLARLRAFGKRRPARLDAPPGRFVTSRRPRGGAGGAEAPIPSDAPLPDLYAPA